MSTYRTYSPEEVFIFIYRIPIWNLCFRDHNRSNGRRKQSPDETLFWIAADSLISLVACHRHIMLPVLDYDDYISTRERNNVCLL